MLKIENFSLVCVLQVPLLLGPTAVMLPFVLHSSRTTIFTRAPGGLLAQAERERWPSSHASRRRSKGTSIPHLSARTSAIQSSVFRRSGAREALLGTTAAARRGRGVLFGTQDRTNHRWRIRNNDPSAWASLDSMFMSGRDSPTTPDVEGRRGERSRWVVAPALGRNLECKETA